MGEKEHLKLTETIRSSNKKVNYGHYKNAYKMLITRTKCKTLYI